MTERRFEVRVGTPVTVKVIVQFSKEEMEQLRLYYRCSELNEEELNEAIERRAQEMYAKTFAAFKKAWEEKSGTMGVVFLETGPLDWGSCEIEEVETGEKGEVVEFML